MRWEMLLQITVSYCITLLSVNNVSNGGWEDLRDADYLSEKNTFKYLGMI